MVKELLEERRDKKNFRIEIKKAFINNNEKVKKAKKIENIKKKQLLKQANLRANKELKSNNNAEVEVYASKTKLKRKELTQIKFEVDITEKYKFIYNYYKKYIDSIIDIEEKVSFIEEQKLYAENSFGSFRGIGINNILSIDGALLIGFMATVIAEFIKFSVSEICRAVLNKEYFISNEWDFITASGIFICIILFRMGRNSKSEKEDDIFNGLCIRALEKIESEIIK